MGIGAFHAVAIVAILAGAMPASASTQDASPTPAATPDPGSSTLDASPKSISFSSQVVGSQGGPAKVALINTSATMPVMLAPPTVSTGFVLMANNCPAELQPRASCTIEVAFVPASKGKQVGKLQFNTNASSGLLAVKLKGRGLAPKMKMIPKSLSFGEVAADAVSPSQSITLVNRSPARISFTTAPAATPPFNVSANTCDTIAANGGTCTVSVEFAPHKRGRYEGTLELRDNAANSPQHVKLLGSSK
jgi:hypothetical protein